MGGNEWKEIGYYGLFKLVDYNEMPGAKSYNSMENWPAYMQVLATDGFSAVEGAIDIYNNKLRGFKELVIIEGGLPWWGYALYNHYTLTAMPGNLFGISGYFPYVLVEMSSFAKQIVLNDPPTNNSGTTTVEQAVCKSVKRADLLLGVRQKQIDKSLIDKNLEGFKELFEDSLY